MGGFESSMETCTNKYHIGFSFPQEWQQSQNHKALLFLFWSTEHFMAE